MIIFGEAPSFWAWLADVATTLGFAAAIFGGVVALFSYRSANRASENAHMHTLFRDYLRMRFDYAMGAAACGRARSPRERGAGPEYGIAEQLAGLKLYALEEMWLWIRRQERAFMMRWPMRLTRQSRERRDFLDAWRNTVLTHVNQDRFDVAESILGFTNCYSVAFLEFAAAGWEGDRKAFAAVLKQQRAQRRRRRRRAHCPDAASARAMALKMATG